MEEGRISRNKQLKLTKLYDAAYELFGSKGIHNTVIDDIVKKAGVAKGTFYLYFKDKHDLRNRLILKKSSAVIAEALHATEGKRKSENLSYQDEVIAFIDYLIEYFKKDNKFLSIIYKNLSWGLYKEIYKDTEMGDAVKRFIHHFESSHGDTESAQKKLYIIVEMVGGVCYNSIILGSPYQIDEIKPEIYQVIKKILID